MGRQCNMQRAKLTRPLLAPRHGAFLPVVAGPPRATTMDTEPGSYAPTASLNFALSTVV